MDPSSTHNAKNQKKSLFARKPVRRTSIDDPHSPTPNRLAVQTSPTNSPSEPSRSPGAISREPSSDGISPKPNRSIIPESLRELPSWYHTESELAAATNRQFRGRYPIHNPVGPHFYRNVHLLPPNRPSSVFSPSFPPMSTEPAQSTSPSRTPSSTPLPTPSSSQTRIPDPSGKGRTRKLSNTTPDNVDLLDASDPHGTNWHHQSPYDGLGLNGDRNLVSPDTPDARLPPRSRSRMSSLGAGSHHIATTPSPLSQMHPPLVHKLTKRRKPFEGLFGASSASAADTASVAGSTLTVTNKLFSRQSILKSASTTSIPQSLSNASIVPSEKRQKHSSLFGRFARRFSIIRRAAPGKSRRGSIDSSNEWSRGDRQSLQVTDRTSTTTRPTSLANLASPSENSQTVRIPPPQAGTTPSVESTPIGNPEDENAWGGEWTQYAKRDSISSLQVSYSIGRLTVANPDAPSSTDGSPINQVDPLPAIRTALAPTQRPSPGKDKPLPPPAPPSSPFFLEIPKFESLSSLMPVSDGSTTPTGAPAPTTRAISGEGWRLQSTPPFSSPVPISRAVPTSEQRASPSSRPSATRAPALAPLSPSTNPSANRISLSASPAINDSPLSRASIIANPPTPYVEPTRINNSPVTVQAPAPTVQPFIPSPVITQIISSPSIPTANESHTPASRESLPPRNQTARFPKSSSSVRSRETETFHLVRSPSAGAVQPTGQSIIVAGEQWEVVGGGTQRSRTKKEKEDAKRSNVEPEQRDGRRLDRTTEKVPAPASSKTESRKSRMKESSSSRRRSDHTEGNDRVRRSPTVPSSRGALSPNPAPERRLSQSQGRRPTSELTSAADMNALRAREVWEMDRLWKGRSVAYGLEGPQVVYAQSIGEVGSTTSVNGLNNGSAHTGYKLQQGFPFPTTSGVYSPQALSSSAQLTPPAPPPPQSFSQTMQGPMYEFPSGVRGYPDLANIPSIGSPESTPSLPSRHPLPSPPRESRYHPGPVPASFIEKNDSATADYWNKFAGVSVVSPMR
ncbi:hypothetical protein F5148DRAFT_1186936 [Russula earlei]|uniref:Uncharacterized protein n=1 Tax=Russula earlei TaxID=71964 RepID=A0ACC0UD09_9AGAM|nr:hypothetical protein F5148DRAFT_1186936 [Russula earlei]